MSTTGSGKVASPTARSHIAPRPDAQPRGDQGLLPDHAANHGAAAMTAARPPRLMTPGRVRQPRSTYRPYDDPSNYLG